MIVNALLSDWEAIKTIYIEGIRTKNATFETEQKITDAETWFQKKISGSVFKYLDDGNILGWASLSPVSDRCVYAGVAEVSVYVALNHSGKGIGHALLNKLIEFAESNGVWTLQAGIFSENKASIHLHEKCGFRIVGVREKIGQLDGEWRDNTFMERRSKTIL